MAKKRTASRKSPFGHKRVQSQIRKLRRSLVALQAKFQECERQLLQERQGRDEARTENLAKDDFIATLSHELRTPLSSIIVWAELLLSGKLDPQTSVRALQSIERNSKAQAQLVEDLLDVSRIGSHKLKLNLEEVSLPQVLEAALDAVRKTAEEKGIAIQTCFPSAGFWVRGDAIRLRQVFWNLFSNAIKFTPAGGNVAVVLEEADSNARVIVSDTGKGINEHFLPHVFEPYKQAEDVENGRHPGLGLGLAIVQQLLLLHQGCVHASSDGENKGARFTVILPLLKVQSGVTAQLPTAEEFSVTPLWEKRILVVDDEPDECAWLTAALTEVRAEVVATSSVEMALASYESCPPNLIVTDIGFPEKNGFDLLREIRHQDGMRERHTPVVALTAYAREQDRRRAISAGFDLYISKPVEPGVLVRLLSTLMQQDALKFANS